MRSPVAVVALIVLACGSAAAGPAAPVMVQDFEEISSPPTVWVVNIPNENASVQLSKDQPHDGKHCLKLHYHFVSAGSFQYLGVRNKVSLQGPGHKLRFWLKGDNSNCSYGLRVTDAGGETHQYSKNTGQGGIIDFTGWREVVIDLDSGHETWGGDNNGKIDYPITDITLTLSQPMEGEKLMAVESELSFDSLTVETGIAIGKKAFEGMHNPIRMSRFGIPSSWFEAFHTYGCKITESVTIYYCDNIEVGRHPTFPLSRQRRLFFLVNLATGGGWPVDLSRYHGLADMYIDYIRVYQQTP